MDPLSTPDFDRMTKDEVIAWFDAAGDISPLLAGMDPASEPVARAATDAPMMLDQPSVREASEGSYASRARC